MLIFIAPAVFLPLLLQDIATDLDLASTSSVQTTDIAIWQLPADVTYVDVLATKVSGPEKIAKGKDRALQQWEEEVRQSLAAKKVNGALPTKSLTKAEKALVDAQLAKEAIVRQQVDVALSHLRRGLRIVASLLRSPSEEVLAALPLLLDAVLAVFAIPLISLVKDEAYQLWQALSQACSTDAMDYRLPLSWAILRSLRSPVVPLEAQSEDIRGG